MIAIITISLCMIVKNEEENLKNCLDSVHDLVDEINIVDTGSTDRTVEIAKQYTDRVFFFDWIDDFSAARNFSFSKATKEYIMWLDADDIIEGENRNGFKAFKRNEKGQFDCYFMDYAINKDADGNIIESTKRERVVKRSTGFTWSGVIHEFLTCEDPSIKVAGTDISITHTKTDTDFIQSLIRNANALMKVIESGKARPMDYYYYGVSLNALGLHLRAVEPLKYFIENNDRPDFSGTDAYVRLYNSYMALGDRENAYLTLALNEEINKDKSEYYCMMGNFMEAVLKDCNKAVQYYQRALTCEGKERGVYRFLQRNDTYYYYEPLYRLGQCYVKLRDYKNAGEAFKKAVTYRPNDKELAALTEKISKIAELMP
jgi:glycosyltransferase involved in cell wall biosynthesis